MTGKLNDLKFFLNEYHFHIQSISIRGALGSTIMFTYNIGILIAFLLGNFCDYYTTPKLVLGLAVLFPFLFNSFPETPSYLFKQKQTTVSNYLILKCLNNLLQ